MPPTPQSYAPRAAPLCVSLFCCPVKKKNQTSNITTSIWLNVLPKLPYLPSACLQFSPAGPALDVCCTDFSDLWSLREASSHVPVMRLYSQTTLVLSKGVDRKMNQGQIYQRTKYLSRFFIWCKSHMFAVLLAGHKVVCHFFKHHASTFLSLSQVFQA